MINNIDKIRQELQSLADEDTRKSGQRFFKETVRLYGVKTALVRRIGNTYGKGLKQAGKEEVFARCEELWQSGFLEEAIIACSWAHGLRTCYEAKDFFVFEHWLQHYVRNWASCDTLCNHPVGALVEMFPEHLAGLQRWAVAGNRWLRRAAAVSLIVPAKKGLFLEDVLAIADILLVDDDDLVQKGYGWLLKVASQAHPGEVYAYVMAHKGTMPRTALRYAIEKLPGEMKLKAMEK
jgi:3-methyladenine DNA glycosylase AlkD